MSLFRRRYPIADPTGKPHISVHGVSEKIDSSYFEPPSGPYNYDITGLVTSELSIEFAASLEFPISFTSMLNANMRFYLLDLMATIPEMPPEEGQVFGKVFGLGVRIGIATTKVKAEAAASISGVAARAELGIEQATYSFVAPGVGPGVMAKAGKFFATAMGTFDASKVEDLGMGLEVISNYLLEETKNKDHPPKAIYVTADAPKKDQVEMQAISTAWAINRIEHFRSYNEAMKELNKDNPKSGLVNALEVQALYQSIVNNAGDDKPSEPQQRIAKLIQNMRGPFA